MKRIIVNKDSKALYTYEGIDYLVENYPISVRYSFNQKYVLYSTTTVNFLFFFSYYPKLKEITSNDACSQEDVKDLIQRYLREKKNKELAELKEKKFYDGGVL